MFIFFEGQMIRLRNGLLTRKKTLSQFKMTMKVQNDFRSGKVVGQALVLCDGTSNVASLLYRCATTGMNVQAWFADDVSDDNLYVSLRCPACARVHLVNRAGKTLLPPMP
jgi:hypothetical protein